MVVGWSAEGDFAMVLDTLESLSLRRAGSGDVAWTRSCWRFAETTTDVLSPTGAVQRSDVVWQVPAETGEAPPRPGDALIDTEGNCAVVRSAERLQGETRYRCITRSTTLRFDATERFEVEEPVFEQASEGAVLVGWRTVRPAVAGIVLAADGSLAKKPADAHSVVTKNSSGVREGVRLQWSRGGTLRVTEVSRPDGIGGPFVATVHEDDASAS